MRVVLPSLVCLAEANFVGADAGSAAQWQSHRLFAVQTLPSSGRPFLSRSPTQLMTSTVSRLDEENADAEVAPPVMPMETIARESTPVWTPPPQKGKKRIAFATATFTATSAWFGSVTGSVFFGAALAGATAASVAYLLARRPKRPQFLAGPPMAKGPAENDLGVHLVPLYELHPIAPKGPISAIETTVDIPEGPDPFEFVKGDVRPLSDGMKDLINSDNPVLQMACTQLLEGQRGKQVRPTLVTIMSYACSSLTVNDHKKTRTFALQGQLAQITEMIHVASLIHDDVLDEADQRRGAPSVHAKYGNKVAVLAGDFLLATASNLLAELEDTRVVNLMASALKSLVQGEVMQLKLPPEKYCEMDSYIKKSYHKTASLITLSLRSAAILGGHEPNSKVTNAAGEFGYHMGLAFQIVDDILDFTASTDEMGKPVCADMELGLATAPVLYAMEEDPSLKPRIMRRFKEPEDVSITFDAVHGNDGLALQKARSLAKWHGDCALQALEVFPETEAKAALGQLVNIVLTRKK
jgi:geranyl diphosphate synthase